MLCLMIVFYNKDDSYKLLFVEKRNLEFLLPTFSPTSVLHPLEHLCAWTLVFCESYLVGLLANHKLNYREATLLKLVNLLHSVTRHSQDYSQVVQSKGWLSIWMLFNQISQWAYRLPSQKDDTWLLQILKSKNNSAPTK